VTTKDELHHLIDELGDRDLADAQRILEDIRAHGKDRVARKLLTAPIDDEPETEEERAAVAEAWDAIRRGDVVSDEDLRRQLGL
jgi:hypothetical protein